MGADRSVCRQCGQALPPDANYCAGCGLARESTLLDPLGVGARPQQAAKAVSAVSERLGMLVVVVAIAGLLVLIWALTRGGDSDTADPDGTAAPTESAEASESRSTTTPATSATSSTTAATTSLSPATLFVNDTPGPVLGDGVDDVVVGIRDRTMFRLDLATGEVSSISLERSVDSVGPESTVVIDGEFVSTSPSGALVMTDLTTGAQRETADLGLSTIIGAQVIGAAGSDSIWVVVAGSDGPTTAIEVDLADGILQSFEFPQPFWVQSARGHELYLHSPSGSWRFDTTTGTVEELGGQITRSDPTTLLVITCEPTLECGVEIYTSTGLAPLPFLSSTEVANDSVHVSPDFTEALVHHNGTAPNPESTHVDLATGKRVELGAVPISPYFGILWIPDSPWIIGPEEDGPDLTAVNTETGDQLKLDLPGRLGGFGNPGHLLLVPTS